MAVLDDAAHDISLVACTAPLLNGGIRLPHSSMSKVCFFELRMLEMLIATLQAVNCCRSYRGAQQLSYLPPTLGELEAASSATQGTQPPH